MLDPIIVVPSILIVAVAALLGRMARDMRLLRIRSETLVPAGLLLAVGTGVAPMFLGEPFLRSAHGYLTWPLIGRFEWSTAVVFDAGVFLVVVGTTITIIDLLAEEAHLRRIGVTLEELPEAPMESDDEAQRAPEGEAGAEARAEAQGEADDAPAGDGSVSDGAGRSAEPPRGGDR